MMRVSQVISKLDFVWTNMYFRFGNKYFRQVSGSPVSSSFSPLVAELFRGYLGNKVRRLIFFLRVFYTYVDDIFLI